MKAMCIVELYFLSRHLYNDIAIANKGLAVTDIYPTYKKYSSALIFAIFAS